MVGRLQQAAEDGENAGSFAGIDSEGIRQIHGLLFVYFLVITAFLLLMLL